MSIAARLGRLEGMKRKPVGPLLPPNWEHHLAGLAGRSDRHAFAVADMCLFAGFTLGEVDGFLAQAGCDPIERLTARWQEAQESTWQGAMP
jgi:hypothetical protein